MLADSTDGTPSIVCVHGYGADADVTWSHPVTGKTWINDAEFVNRLPKPARVLSFSYNGDIASNLSAASVAFNADDLLCCIEQALEKSTVSRFAPGSSQLRVIGC